MEETKFHLTMANFLSVTLLLYYLGGVLHFSLYEQPQAVCGH